MKQTISNMVINDSSEVKTPLPSKAFEDKMIDYFTVLKKTTSNSTLLKCIQRDFILTCNSYIKLASQAHDELLQLDINNNEVFLLHYSFAETFKDFAILNRDVLLHLEIAKHKHLDMALNAEAVHNHFLKSQTLLLEVTESFLKTINSEHESIYKSTNNSLKSLNSIKHLKNPWSIYKNQLGAITKQIKGVFDSYYPLGKIVETFNGIKSHHYNFIEKITSTSEGLKSQIGKTIKLVEANEKNADIANLIAFIDDAESLIVTDKELNEVYTQAIEFKIQTLGENSIPIETNGGLLFNRTIDFNKTVKKWFDFEILPLLFELWDYQTNMKSFFKHSLINLKSSLLVSKSDENLDSLLSQLKMLKNTHQTISANIKIIEGIALKINQKFESQFNFTSIFSSGPFLEVSIQSSLVQFANEQNTLFGELKDKFNTRFNGVNKKYKKSHLFNNQNKVEATIDCISYRMFKEVNAHYDSLFLNKSFIGDLFLVPREDQELALQNCMEQWQNGFNKSILLTGDRLSGKSTFVEYISKKYFAKHTLHIKPDSTLTYSGRKFTSERDLKAILQNIKKNLHGNKTLIAIDDLELWRDENHSLLSNVRALLSFIEATSSQVLVIVTSSIQMQEHLDKRLSFSEYFSNKINLNKALFVEIHKAVLLRHGATHKTIIDVSNEPFSQKQIERNVNKLAHNLDYNIGEVLQAWTYGTTVIDINNVIYDEKDFKFYDFFNHTEIIILKYVMLYKYINEYMLKNFLSSSQETQFKSSLKRLINTKILLRDNEGWLYLNMVINKDVKQLLTYRGTLN
ncbi:ATP-binding protein [Algibacter sp.]|uniref:ATP-binding protein n=1 Tax=Algibacter sp. TaxID=1872428 RepID=UPI003C74EFEC